NGTITNGRGRLEIHTWYEKFVNLNKVNLNCPFDTVNKRRKYGRTIKRLNHFEHNIKLDL
ncbi:hypothetical protein, partial [Paenibacillus phytorum]|uniref:hypothetical protein n=1 Tax=Paenibacillus phytorum TaxID=2654977 RepID=UPI001C0F8349